MTQQHQQQQQQLTEIENTFFQLLASELVKMSRDTKKLFKLGCNNTSKLELTDKNGITITIYFDYEHNSWILDDGYVKSKFNPTMSEMRNFTLQYDPIYAIVQLKKLRLKFENTLKLCQEDAEDAQ